MHNECVGLRSLVVRGSSPCLKLQSREGEHSARVPAKYGGVELPVDTLVRVAAGQGGQGSTCSLKITCLIEGPETTCRRRNTKDLTPSIARKKNTVGSSQASDREGGACVWRGGGDREKKGQSVFCTAVKQTLTS